MLQQRDDRRVIAVSAGLAHAWVAAAKNHRIFAQCPNEVLRGVMLVIPEMEIAFLKIAVLGIDWFVLLLAVERCPPLAGSKDHQLIVTFTLGPEHVCVL